MNRKKGNPLKRVKYFIKTLTIYFRWKLFGKAISDFKRIPIIINNYNRLTTLTRLIEALEERGYRNIYIIDNASTYPPLLKYYETCPYHIFRLKKNIGHKSIWKTGIYKKFWRSYYVYTDSDVVPIASCPDDFIEHFCRIMMRYEYATKVGFGLKIDDLPEVFKHKHQIINDESDHWRWEVEKDLYRSVIDTTFALYRPFSKTNTNWYMEHYRTGGQYMLHHLPWYNDTKKLSEEELFYIKSCSKSSTLGQRDKETEIRYTTAS